MENPHETICVICPACSKTLKMERCFAFPVLTKHVKRDMGKRILNIAQVQSIKKAIDTARFPENVK